MRSETKYFADDGKEFDNKYECRSYEDALKKPEREILKNYVLFYGVYGGKTPYSPYIQPTYVYLKKIPTNDDPARRIWNEVLSEELAEVLEGFRKEGWYVCGNDDKWEHLSVLQKRLKNTEKKIKDIVKNFEEDF